MNASYLGTRHHGLPAGKPRYEGQRSCCRGHHLRLGLPYLPPTHWRASRSGSITDCHPWSSPHHECPSEINKHFIFQARLRLLQRGVASGTPKGKFGQDSFNLIASIESCHESCSRQLVVGVSLHKGQLTRKMSPCHIMLMVNLSRKETRLTIYTVRKKVPVFFICCNRGSVKDVFCYHFSANSFKCSLISICSTIRDTRVYKGAK